MRIPIPLSIPFVVSNSLVPAAMPTIPSLTPSRTLLSTPRVLPLIPTLPPKATGRITRSCVAAQHDKREHPFPTQAAPPMPWTPFHPHRARPSRLRQSRRLSVTPCVAHENFLCHPMPALVSGGGNGVVSIVVTTVTLAAAHGRAGVSSASSPPRRKTRRRGIAPGRGELLVVDATWVRTTRFM
jgi:hypothetical protein